METIDLLNQLHSIYPELKITKDAIEFLREYTRLIDKVFKNKSADDAQGIINNTFYSNVTIYANLIMRDTSTDPSKIIMEYLLSELLRICSEETIDRTGAENTIIYVADIKAALSHDPDLEKTLHAMEQTEK